MTPEMVEEKFVLFKNIQVLSRLFGHLSLISIFMMSQPGCQNCPISHEVKTTNEICSVSRL